jgi:TetR/AcrR family transcriptional regulator, transcriptional repressor for nem operon
MARPASDIGPRIVHAARARFLQEGVDGAALRQIARDAGTNIGMVYYYFKTKDDLLAAVLASYDGDYVLLRSILSQHDDPRDRLKALVVTWTMAKERIASYGCPLGSLCSELSKRPPDQISDAAGVVLAKLVGVAEELFEALGRSDAHDLAITLVAAYEGAALLSHAMHDPEILADHAARLTSWIDSLEVPAEAAG